MISEYFSVRKNIEIPLVRIVKQSYLLRFGLVESIISCKIYASERPILKFQFLQRHWNMICAKRVSDNIVTSINAEGKVP